MAAPQPTPTPTPADQSAESQQQAQSHEGMYVPAEDRILSPEETVNLLRGHQPRETEPPDDPTPPDQVQMVQEFFGELPPQAQPQAPEVPGQVPLPHEQIQQMAQQQMQPQPQQQQQQAAPQPPGPAELPPSAIQEMVQQSMQSGGPTPPQQQPQQVPVQTQVSPEMAALQAQNQLLQTQIQALNTQIQQMAQAPPQPQQQTLQQQQAQMDYNFQVPPQFLAGIQSENPAEAQFALNTLLNNVAQTITNQVRQEQQGLREEVGGIVQSQMGNYNTQQEVQRDMYGTYPELSPHRHLVQAVARELSNTMPQQTPWSPELRDQIAEKVSPMVPGLYQKIQQNRAQRMGQQPVYQQPLPQQQQPAGYLPAQAGPPSVGHMQQVPTLARDAQGNLVHVQGAPQPYMGSPHARGGGGSAVSPEVADIWRTLGYEPYQ